MKLVSWLQRAYPISFVIYEIHEYTWSYDQTPKEKGESAINDQLAAFRRLDGSPPNWHSVDILILWGHKAPLCPSLPDASVADRHPQW